MKKILTITLLSVFLLGIGSIQKADARRYYSKYRVKKVYVVNRSFRTLRGIVYYKRNNRSLRRRFILRPKARLIIRADRNSYLRFRYNGRRTSRRVSHNNQRVYLR